MLRWLYCIAALRQVFFCYFWIYDNVLINSLGIPGGRTKTRKGNSSRVSLEGLLSGEQIFSRETKLVVLPRWLCWGYCDVEWPNFLMDRLCHEWPSRDIAAAHLFNLFRKKKRLPKSSSLRGSWRNVNKNEENQWWTLAFFSEVLETTVFDNQQKCLIWTLCSGWGWSLQHWFWAEN